MILQLADRWEETTTEARNAALAFVILGSAAGACFGLAGGLVRRSVGRGLVAGVVGLVAGVAGSAAMAAAVLSPYNSYRYQHPDEASRDLLLPLLVHGSIWSVAGLAGGLAFALGAGGNRRLIAKVAVAGVVGVLVGTLIFELCGNLVFEEFDSGKLVATTWTGRLVARFAVTLATRRRRGSDGLRPAEPTSGGTSLTKPSARVRRPGGSGGSPGDRDD